MVIEKIDDIVNKKISAFNSSHAYFRQLLNIKTESQVGIISLDAGGNIGSHAAPANQKMLIIDGTATVSTTSDKDIVVKKGTIITWNEGEVHETRSITGMLALVIEY